ncbi:MAG: YbjQ family protein [Desulfobacterales bacterium]|nr:YbjQ family protein [Desulfobacterales bacterium]
MEQLIIFIVLIMLGYFFGRMAESKHYRSIEERERFWMTRPASTYKTVSDSTRAIRKSELVSGNVVISVDYFKRIAAGLRNLFGGEVRVYETLVDRARREALLRLHESCEGADEIINLRLETSSIYKGKRKQVGSVEVLAFGTAVYFEQN